MSIEKFHSTQRRGEASNYAYVLVYLKYSNRESISKAFSCVWGFSNIAPSAT